MLQKSCPVSLLIFAFLLAACSPKHYNLVSSTPQVYYIDSTLTGDVNIEQLLYPYKVGVDTQMTVVIGHTDIPLTKAQPESTLGNFMADAQLQAARLVDKQTVASVMNYGGVRLSYIAPGAITRGKIYELMPFDNMLTIAEVSGPVVQEFCDAMAQRRGWPVSGITYTIKNKKAEDVKIGGQPINNARFYKIAVSDYIARGGDNCTFLQGTRKKYTTIFVRDILINFLLALEAKNENLHPELDNRVSYAE